MFSMFRILRVATVDSLTPSARKASGLASSGRCTPSSPCSWWSPWPSSASSGLILWSSFQVREMSGYDCAYNRTFPCMEANCPLCHKEPARRGILCSKALIGGLGALGLWMPELVLYCLRLLTNERRASTFLDQ